MKVKPGELDTRIEQQLEELRVQCSHARNNWDAQAQAKEAFRRDVAERESAIQALFARAAQGTGRDGSFESEAGRAPLSVRPLHIGQAQSAGADMGANGGADGAAVDCAGADASAASRPDWGLSPSLSR